MNKFKFLGTLFMGAGSLLSFAGTPAVERIDPPNWWTGMANDTLQLMVSGPDIAKYNVSVDYPGISLLEQLNLDSPNYKFLYLRISPDVKAGEIPLVFRSGKKKLTQKYPLLSRTKKGEDYEGFSASDVLYLLMPDRFAQGKEPDRKVWNGMSNPVEPDRSDPNGRHGGDIAGVIDHLDYLDSLGVTAIWATPVLENDMVGGSYHGYATTDYYRIDPRFGTNEEWKQMVKEANKRGMKVVMDMIFNHSGSDHPWMKDLPSKDWYNHPEGDVLTNFRLTTVHDPYVSDYDLDHTVNGWFVPSMPDLNQKNPHLNRYLIQNSIWWIESSGLNGIRMDTYPYADATAMAEWQRAVAREYPNFNIVGESWYSNEAGPAFWQKGNKINPEETSLPTVMDFRMLIDGHKIFDEETDPWNGLNLLYDHLSMDFLYPDPQHILTFLDNHDSDRFLLEEPKDLGSWKQAQTWLLTSRGIPQIYYGTEILMNGSKKVTDGNIRKDFPGGFPGDSTDAFTAEGRTDLQNEAWNFLSKLLNWRKGEANEVIAKGTLKHFMPQNGLYVFERRLGDKQVVVIMNGSDKKVTKTMERTLEILPYGTEMLDIISGEKVKIEPEMEFAPRQVMILQNF